MDPDVWVVLDRLMQWLIIPAAGAVWWLTNRMGSMDREILRILTVLEERNSRRSEDREETAAAFKQLREAIQKLTEKIDTLARERKP